MRRTVLLLLGLFGGASCGKSASASDPGPILRAFSHNDFNRTHPLDDALQVRIGGVEADVLLYNGDILLGENILETVGKFEPLYLEKLKKRIDAMGSVYGDGRTFYLWIDIKSDDADLRAALDATLGRYASILTRYDAAGGVDTRAITVVLTGSDASKKALAAEPASPRIVVRDSNDFSADDPVKGKDTVWPYYALSYKTYVGDWDGTSPLPDDQAQKLKDLVRGVHDKGRQLRIWAAPDTVASWSAQYAAGVDLIGADDLPGLADFLNAQHSPAH